MSPTDPLPTSSEAVAEPRWPASPTALFLAFSRLALRGFGGVLPWAQRVTVEEERWLTNREFADLLALAQLLPGPNVCNLALMIGDRFFGTRGALAALAGMFAGPLAVILVLALAYDRFASRPEVAGALQGMAAVSAGLVLAIAFKLLRTRRGEPIAWAFAAATFVAVGVLRWPLLAVMVVLGIPGIALAGARRER